MDEAELRRLSADFAGRMASIEELAHRLAGHPFGLGSPKQLGEVLFDEQGMPGGKRSPSGQWVTDAAVLQTLSDLGHELPGRVLEWRQLAKLKSTYADALVGEINPATGRVHTSYAMAATSTGRLSSNDPNLQNIPIRTEEGGRIRRAFVAEPGHKLVSADYSQIELRLLAHVADIETLREAFSTGQDIHARTASEVFGIPLEQMDRTTRSRAKAINFGIIYGISAFGLARQLGIDAGEAGLYIADLFRALSRHPRLHGTHQGRSPHPRLRHHPLRPPLHHPRHRRPQHAPAAPAPNARPSTPPSKAAPPTSSNAPWSNIPAALARLRPTLPLVAVACTTNCCSKRRMPRPRCWLVWPNG